MSNGRIWKVISRSMMGGLLMLPLFSGNAQAVELKVMSYNVWQDATCEGCFDNTVQAILESGADVVGLQEANALTCAYIARELGWFTSRDAAIISRYPMLDSIRVDKHGGALLDMGVDGTAWVFNAHLPSTPYGPYAYAPRSSVSSALKAETNSRRVSTIQTILTAMQPYLANSTEVPVFLTGDFNSPSWRDWRSAIIDEPAYGEITRTLIDWPVSLSVEAAGLVDSYREFYPDVEANRGNTWTALSQPEDKEVFDRIDFVWYAGEVTVLDSARMGDGLNPDDPDILEFSGVWASDHRAVISTFSW